MRSPEIRSSFRAHRARPLVGTPSLIELLACEVPHEPCIVPGSRRFAIDASFALDARHDPLGPRSAAPAARREACESLGTLP